MEIINVNLDNRVIQLMYEDTDGFFKFKDDIIIGSWVVLRTIKIGGPQSSCYKYNFKNYFEFVIRDDEGTEGIQKWFHNSGDEFLDAYWAENGAINALPFFLANHPIFKCRNWRDFEASMKLQKIRKCLNMSTDNIQIFDTIKHICEKS